MQAQQSPHGRKSAGKNAQTTVVESRFHIPSTDIGHSLSAPGSRFRSAQPFLGVPMTGRAPLFAHQAVRVVAPVEMCTGAATACPGRCGSGQPQPLPMRGSIRL